MNRGSEGKEGSKGDQFVCVIGRTMVVIGRGCAVCYGGCYSPDSQVPHGFTQLHCWDPLLEEVTTNDFFCSLRAHHLPTWGFAHLDTALGFNIALLGRALAPIYNGAN